MIRWLFTLSLAWILTGSNTLFGGDQWTWFTNKDTVKEAVDVQVESTTSDGQLTITITKDGETKTVTFPLNQLESMADLQEKLKEIDEDLADDWSDLVPQNVWHYMSSTWLGVKIQSLTGQLRKYFEVDDDVGVLVTEVVDGSPAQAAQLEAGDVIIKIDDQIVDSPSALRRMIREYEPETDVSLTVIRQGKEKTIDVILAENPDSMSWSNLPSPMDTQHFFRHRQPLKDFYFYHKADIELEDELDSLREEMNELKRELEKLKQ